MTEIKRRYLVEKPSQEVSEWNRELPSDKYLTKEEQLRLRELQSAPQFESFITGLKIKLAESEE